jgi:ribose/xylose/arabinose/galactoside ABC-type transport system permease subunit
MIRVLEIGYNKIDCVGSGTIYNIPLWSCILLGVGLLCGFIWGYIVFYKKNKSLKGTGVGEK